MRLRKSALKSGLIFCALFLSSLQTASGSAEEKSDRIQIGKASYYGNRFEGQETASGETFHNDRLTAAHRDLPFGTLVRVTNLRNDKSIVVRVNDRGPYARGRIIDLSKRAAKKLGIVRTGLAPVKVEVIGDAQG